MVVAVAALFEIIDVIGAVLIIGHGVAHIGLADAVDGGQEEGLVFIGRFLAAGGAQRGEILIVRDFREGLALLFRRFRSGWRGVVSSAARQQHAQNTQHSDDPHHFTLHCSLLIDG